VCASSALPAVGALASLAGADRVLRARLGGVAVAGLSCFRPRRPPRPALFPYTTLFRSRAMGAPDRRISFAPPPPRTRASGSCPTDRKSTRLNSSHRTTSYAVFCLKKKAQTQTTDRTPVAATNAPLLASLALVMRLLKRY